jgi:hypothetical protein
MRPIAFGGSILVLCTVLCGHASAQATNSRAIYRCEAGGVLTFSDRPCTTGAEQYELDAKALNTFEPPPVSPASRRAATQSQSAKRTSKKASGPAVDPAKRREKCERLTQSLKDVRAKQRSGYKAREGERLKDREAKLKSQLRESRCS